MPASRRNHSSSPAKDLSVQSAFPTARDIWLKARRRLLKATAAPVAAAALVFPSLMDPAPAAAQSYDLVESDGTVVLGDLMPISGSMGLSSDGANYLVFQKMINEGVGFNDGYSAIGLHATLKDWGLTHLFSDSRVQITDHSRIGANTLLGLRRVVGQGVVGGWVGYDNWESFTGNRYDQISFGAEALFQDFDVRANVYLPLDDESNFLGFTGQGTGAPFFMGNALLSTDPALAEESVQSWNVEAGVPTISQAARLYAGVYGLHPDLQDSAIGASGRLELRATNNVTLNFSGSYDDIYQGNFNVLAEVRFSGTPNSSGFLPCFDCNYRRHGQVRRDWVVKTAQSNVEADRALLDPVTGLPLDFVHVDNTNGAPGDGTWENPFQMLPNSAPGANFVLVDRGDLNPTTGNIVLEAGQQILGEGKPIIIPTDRGRIQAPGYGTTGRLPLLSPADPNSPVITIADDSVVRGFQFLGPATSTAIAGGSVDNFLIECVTGTIGDGVVIADGTGTGIIREAEFNILDENGYFVGNNGGSLNLTINDVVATAMGGDFGVVIDSTGGDIRADLDDITLDGFSTAGVLAQIDDGTLNLTGDAIDVLDTGNTAGAGVQIDASTSVGATTPTVAIIDIDDLTTSGSTDGFIVTTDDAQFDVDLTNATIDAGASGVVLDASGGNGQFRAVNIDAQNAGVDGVRIAAEDVTNVGVQLASVNVTGAGENALDVRATSTVGSATPTTLNLNATNIAGGNAGADGVSLLSTEDSVLNANLTQITATNAMLDGMQAVANGGRINFNADTLRLSDAGDDGLDVVAVNEGLVDGSIANVTASNADNEGLSFGAASDGSINLDVTDATATGSGTNGLFVQGGSGGTLGDVELRVMNGNFSTSTDSNVVIMAQGDDGPAPADSSYVRVTADNLIANGSLTDNGIEVTAMSGGDARLVGTSVAANNNLAGSGLVLDSMGVRSTVAANLEDSSFNNNGVDGVEVSGSGQSSTTATLAGTTINNSGVNGIDIDLTDAGTTGQVTLSPSATNQTTILNSGVDAINYLVENGAELDVAGDSVVMTGSGVHGFDGSVQGAGSIATVNFDNSDAGDQGRNGANLNVGNVTGGAEQVFRFTNGQLDNNNRDGLRANVDNASILGVTISDTDMSVNGEDGVDVVVDGASEGRVTLTNVDASASARRGIAIASDDDSTVDLDLLVVDASNSGLDGVEVFATAGGFVDADIDTLNVSDNASTGLQLRSIGTGINASEIDLVATNVIGDNNQLGGLDSDTVAGGTTTAQFFGGSFSGNGLAGPADGVNVRTNGMGSLADFCFDGTVADGNSQAGYQFRAETDSTLIANLTTSGAFGTLSASNNVDEGLRVDGIDADQVIVTMSGDNQFVDNATTLGSGTNGVTYRFNGVDDVAAQFSGSVSGADGDGVNIRIVDAMRASVGVGDPSLATPSTITGNGDDGIDVSIISNMAAATELVEMTIPLGKQAGTVIEPLVIENNDVSMNGDQGIEFFGDNVIGAAGTFPRIDNNIANDSGAGDGISVTFNDSNLPGGGTGAFSISNNTANNNPLWGIDLKLTNTTVGFLQTDANTTNMNGAGGTRIFVDPSAVGSGSMIGGTAIGNTGDGVHIDVDDSVFNNFTISDSLFQMNTGRGLNFDLFNSTSDGVNLTDNFSGVTDVAGVVFNALSQSSFTLENTSAQPGILLSQFMLDASTAPTAIVWDTEEPGAALPFMPTGGTDAITGLFSVNGNQILIGSNPVTDPGGTALPGGGLPDDQSVLDLVFNDFQPGELFTFLADTDFIMDPASVPNITDFIGSTASATFSNGVSITGTLQATANGVGIVATTSSGNDRGFLENTLEGVFIQAEDSTISNFNMTANRIENNTADGVEISLDNSDFTGSTFEGNLIANNTGDGIRLIDPVTMTGAPIELDLVDNFIQTNGGDGFVTRLQNNESLETESSGNTISGNTGFGIRVVQEDNSITELQLGSSAGNRSTIDGNGDAGIAVTLQNNSVSTFAVENSTISNNIDGTSPAFDGDGIRIRTIDNATLAEFRVGDPAVAGDIVINGNAGDGIALELLNASNSASGPEIYNAEITGNRNGVVIDRQGVSVLDDMVIADSNISSNLGNGILHDFAGSNNNPLDPISTTISDTIVDSNAGTGLLIRPTTDVAVEYTITDSSFSTNTGATGSGIRIEAVDDTSTTIAITDTAMDGNAIDGFVIAATENAVFDADINGGSISNNMQNGVDIDIFNDARGTLDIAGTAASRLEIDGSGAIGIDLTVQNDLVPAVGDPANDFVANISNVSVSNGSAGAISLVGNTNAVTSLSLTDIEANDNGGTGIVIDNNDTADTTVSILDAIVLRNAGYGLQALNGDDGQLTLTVDGTVNPQLTGGTGASSAFSFNELSGIFVQNGNAQGAQAFGTTNTINFTLTDTAANGNGTMGATPEDQAGLIILEGTSTGGSTVANIDRNVFRGNTGTDVLMQSFVSATPFEAGGAAVNPAASAAYEFDPLANLSLRFANNTGDSISVTNDGATFENANLFKSHRSIFETLTGVLRSGQRIATDVEGLLTGTVQPGSSPAQVFFLPGERPTGPNVDIRFDDTLITLLDGLLAGETRLTEGIDAAQDRFILDAAQNFSAAPANGDMFSIGALAQNGLGTSTFVTHVPTLAAGNNTFTTITSDFNSTVVPAGYAPFATDVMVNLGALEGQGFGWSFNAMAGVSNAVFPVYTPTILQDADGMAPFIDSVPTMP